MLLPAATRRYSDSSGSLNGDGTGGVGCSSGGFSGNGRLAAALFAAAAAVLTAASALPAVAAAGLALL